MYDVAFTYTYTNSVQVIWAPNVNNVVGLQKETVTEE